MPAYNFKAQFSEAVESGEKCCTIRPLRARPTQIGDALYLFTGQRTNSCRKLRDAVCVRVTLLQVYLNGIKRHGKLLRPSELKALAVKDGFADADEFLEFFNLTYGTNVYTPGTPALEMELIEWQ